MKLPLNELAEEAGYTEGYYESDNGPFIEPEFNKEKFAELIVRACADHVLESSDRYRKEYFANKILELIDGS